MNVSKMFAAVPEELLHHHVISQRSYMLSTKVLQTDATDSWQIKTAKIGKHAAEFNRGVLMHTDLIHLEQLCMKYGGVVQDIRTGEVLSLCRNGWAFQKWTATSSPFVYESLTMLTGYVVIDDISVRNEFRSNGQITMNFIRHITDMPEVIKLLGKHVYLA